MVGSFFCEKISPSKGSYRKFCGKNRGGKWGVLCKIGAIYVQITQRRTNTLAIYKSIYPKRTIIFTEDFALSIV